MLHLNNQPMDSMCIGKVSDRPFQCQALDLVEALNLHDNRLEPFSFDVQHSENMLLNFFLRMDHSVYRINKLHHLNKKDKKSIYYRIH